MNAGLEAEDEAFPAMTQITTRNKPYQNERGKQMNFKKFFMIAFALAATSIATSAAFAQTGGTQISPMPLPRLAPPDISVKIEMFEDQGCTKPMPNGSDLSYTGGAPAAFVRFTLSNSNSQNTGNFTYKRVIYRNGVKVVDPPAATISLAKS